MAERAVPAIETPKLPRKSTKINHPRTGRTGTLYRTEKIGSSKNSVRRRNKVFAISLARKTAKGSSTESRKALSVSLVCSRRKQDCSMSEAAKRKASQRRPGPKRRDSADEGSNVKLKSTMTIKMNTTVVVRSSRDRNSVRSSLPRRADVLESRLIQVWPNVSMDLSEAPTLVR